MAKLSDSGPDWDAYEQSSSGGSTFRRVAVDPVEALKRIQEIADWRTADTAEAEAERTRFERTSGQ